MCAEICSRATPYVNPEDGERQQGWLESAYTKDFPVAAMWEESKIAHLAATV